MGGTGAPWTMRFTSDLAILLPSPTTSQMYFPVSARVTVRKTMALGEKRIRSLYGSGREGTGLGMGPDGHREKGGAPYGCTRQFPPVVEEHKRGSLLELPLDAGVLQAELIGGTGNLGGYGEKSGAADPCHRSSTAAPGTAGSPRGYRDGGTHARSQALLWSRR